MDNYHGWNHYKTANLFHLPLGHITLSECRCRHTTKWFNLSHSGANNPTGNFHAAFLNRPTLHDLSTREPSISPESSNMAPEAKTRSSEDIFVKIFGDRSWYRAKLNEGYRITLLSAHMCEITEMDNVSESSHTTRRGTDVLVVVTKDECVIACDSCFMPTNVLMDNSRRTVNKELDATIGINEDPFRVIQMNVGHQLVNFWCAVPRGTGKKFLKQTRGSGFSSATRGDLGEEDITEFLRRPQLLYATNGSTIHGPLENMYSDENRNMFIEQSLFSIECNPDIDSVRPWLYCVSK